MKRYITQQIAVIMLFMLCFTLPADASVRRVPSNDLVMEGILAIEMDVEGAKDFSYRGKEGKLHRYVGQITPGEKVKIKVSEQLGSLKSLPKYKKRSCTARSEIIAKKGDKVLEKKKFSKDNKSNLFFEYTVPKDADTVEVFYNFELKNYETNGRGRVCRTSNKIVLTSGKVVPMAITTVAKKGSSGEGSMLKVLLGVAAVGALGFGAMRFMKRRQGGSEAAGNFEADLPPMPKPEYEHSSAEKEEIMTPAVLVKPSAQKPVISQAAIDEKAPKKASFCTECGAKAQDGAEFCTECGHKLN